MTIHIAASDLAIGAIAEHAIASVARIPAPSRPSAAGTTLDGIPFFPNFVPIERADRRVVAAFAGQFEPYSEFNGVNQWCWPHKYRALSQLHGNLVVRFHDDADHPFHTVLGANRVADTLSQLLSCARDNRMPGELRLVPEVLAREAACHPSRLQIADDPANAEYLLSIEGWARLEGSAYKKGREQVNLFNRRHRAAFRPLDLAAAGVQQEILSLFDLWAARREDTPASELAVFRLALSRVCEVAGDELAAFGLYDDSRLIGFFIGEPLPRRWVLAHFWLTDTSYHGIYLWLLHHCCQALHARGYRLMNFEQDLGIPRLARAKQRAYRPCGVLRKYVITETR